MLRKILLGCFLILLVLTNTGCSGKKEEPESDFYVYYMNKDETKVVKEPYVPEAGATKEMIDEFVGRIQQEPENLDYKKVLPDPTKILEYKIDNKQLYLNFSGSYLKIPKITEVLCRAAIVRTMVQIPGVDYVLFMVEGNPLLDSKENSINLMTAESFAENTGEEINTIQFTVLNLYFANKAGDKLIKETLNVHYSSGISMEKLIVKQLIAGPRTKNAYPTIPSQTKILGVSVKDGTCYVNFDEGFLGTDYDLLESIPIYSVVNSLSEVPTINKVQISINGETKKTFRDSIPFDSEFKRNLDLVEVPDAKKEEESGEKTEIPMQEVKPIE